MLMEADWEVEIGPESPIIDASWPGFIDLRRAPHRIHEIEEVSRFPQLAKALVRLNGSCPNEDAIAIDNAISGIWTSKCDVWTLDQCDPYEMDATVEEATTGLACYLDLLPRHELVFTEVSAAQAWARTVVARLMLSEIRCCRADLIIRSAIARQTEGFGITAYLSACGREPDFAAQTLDTALNALADAVCC